MILIKIQIRIKIQETTSSLINNSITHIPLIKLYRTPISLGLRKMKLQENGESYIMLSYMHCILRLI